MNKKKALRESKLLIRKATARDAREVVKIYNYYIENTPVTFEVKKISAAEMEKRLRKRSKKYPWLVGIADGKVIGYAYASLFRERAAYLHTRELTVYIDKASIGKGYGKTLYKDLISRLRKTDCAVLIGSIALPNKGSVKLHEKLGFKKVAHLKKVGYKFGKWIDVGYWEKVIR